jgi:hypothetical protein
VVGVFPLAEIKDGDPSSTVVPRSICHFDYGLTVPKSYLRVLQQRRIRRLLPEWLAVLQETLREWGGRFAFPGDADSRLRSGLAAELDAAQEKEAEGKAEKAGKSVRPGRTERPAPVETGGKDKDSE